MQVLLEGTCFCFADLFPRNSHSHFPQGKILGLAPVDAVGGCPAHSLEPWRWNDRAVIEPSRSPLRLVFPIWSPDLPPKSSFPLPKNAAAKPRPQVCVWHRVSSRGQPYKNLTTALPKVLGLQPRPVTPRKALLRQQFAGLGQSPSRIRKETFL